MKSSKLMCGAKLLAMPSKSHNGIAPWQEIAISVRMSETGNCGGQHVR